jgi:hypothetical protein
MLSDYLAESVDEMRRYLEEFPEIYRDVETDVQSIIERMDILRRKLDAPWPHGAAGPEA